MDFLEDLNCPAYKIASPEINHVPLLEKVAKTKKPVILSKGLAKLADIILAVKVLRNNGCKKIAILQCVSSYPAPLEDQNLKTIIDLKKKFKVMSGLSDHTENNISAITSVALGGSIVEKHFNISDNTNTVDSFFSADYGKFKNLVRNIRQTEKTIGKISYQISKSSKKHLVGRRSIYVSKNIKKGEKISLKNIKVVRPAFGLHPKYKKKILGKVLKRSLEAGSRLKLNYLK